VPPFIPSAYFNHPSGQGQAGGYYPFTFMVLPQLLGYNRYKAMKARITGIVLGVAVLGVILYLVVPRTANSSLSPALPEVELADGTAQLTTDFADTSPGRTITRSYTWHYDGKEWTWEIEIPQGLYRYYKEMPRLATNNYSVYVTHTADDQYIRQLVLAIEGAAAEHGYSQYQTIELATAFVQYLPYNDDSLTTPYDEYPRYPVETLVDNGGDCEDTSILLASILDSMGYGVVLVNPLNHLAVGVLCQEGTPGRYYQYKGGCYYYLETTDPAWSIGELPHSYRFSPAYVYGIEPISILNHLWTTRAQDDAIMLEVTVENSGAVAASDVYLWAGFEVGDGQWLNPQMSRGFDVSPGGSVVVGLTLRMPTHRHTRLLVQIVDDGYAVDSSWSYWLDE
jgi:hypothetical protein